MSDLSSARSSNDTELRQFADALWSSETYQSWRDNALRAVANGSIYDEPQLEDFGHAHA